MPAHADQFVDQTPLEAVLGEVGLCASCQHRRLVASGKGSRFLYCRRSETDPLFPKYPRLPVIRCHGYERGEEQGGKPPPGSPP